MTSDLHHDSLIIDGLNASWFLDPQVLRNLRQGGVTAVNATIAAWHNPAETFTMLGDIYALFTQHADLIQPVRTLADISAAKASQRVGFILGFQDTAPIADNPRLLAVYHALGVRIIQLTYNFQNLVGSGCQAPDDTGLTAFGREVVAEMNRLGIVVDLSHCGPRTTLEAIDGSAQPVAVTHANPRARCNHPRNKTDDVLKALADRGGVVGMVAFPLMVTGTPEATLDDYIGLIDYTVNLIGIHSVALGPDFMEAMPREVAMRVLSGMPPEIQDQLLRTPPMRGFESIARCANVTAALLARGYRPDDVRLIMGGNWLRLYRQIWAA